MTILKVLAATGIDMIDQTIKGLSNYELCGIVEERSNVISLCKQNHADILVLSENLMGKESIMEIIISLKMQCPNIRVVFLTGDIENSPEKKQFFETLVFAGVYDFVHAQKISDVMLQNALDNPKTKDDVTYLIRKSFFQSQSGNKFSFENTQKKDEIKDYYDNVFSVSSIKPGTGKTTISVNVATTIAAFGDKREDGKPPKVALIEADLQNLSLGTVLQIENDKFNLKTAFDAISSLFDDNNRLTLDETAIEKTDHIIEQCFLPYSECSNLYALVGSQLTLDQFIGMEKIYYYYIIGRICSKYDVIIIDTNSSLAHSTTYPFLEMSKNCFYILNLDFNNVRNNVRYTSFLRDLGVLHKIKYVLNEDIPEGTNNAELGDYEKLKYSAKDVEKKFDFVAKVPMLPKVVFLNNLIEGTPISLDTKEVTRPARMAIAEIANEIWPMSNYMAELKSSMPATPIKQKKKGFFRKK